MRRFMIMGIVGLAALGGIAGTSPIASAQDGCWSDGFGFGGYGGGYRGFGSGYGGYGGYFGNGGHDAVPHWHQTTTPFGSFGWYGLGAHDFQPHVHSISPYSYQGYSVSPWGNTTSYYPRYPGYTYAPW
jgi:hypothetical protein